MLTFINNIITSVFSLFRKENPNPEAPAPPTMVVPPIYIIVIQDHITWSRRTTWCDHRHLVLLSNLGFRPPFTLMENVKIPYFGRTYRLTEMTRLSAKSLAEDQCHYEATFVYEDPTVAEYLFIPVPYNFYKPIMDATGANIAIDMGQDQPWWQRIIYTLSCRRSQT